MILMGDFLTDTIFREEIYDHIITMSEFTARYEDTVYKTDQMLAAEMDIDPEYASLVVPTMVICKSFLDVFQAEAVWVPVCRFWTVLRMILRKEKIYKKVPIILKMTFWSLPEILPKDIPAVKTIFRGQRSWL